jgi:hypothetical protein
MALVNGESVKNDAGPSLAGTRPVSFGPNTGMKARSRRATDVTGWTDHDSERDARRPREGCL